MAADQDRHFCAVVATQSRFSKHDLCGLRAGRLVHHHVLSCASTQADGGLKAAASVVLSVCPVGSLRQIALLMLSRFRETAPAASTASAGGGDRRHNQ